MQQSDQTGLKLVIAVLFCGLLAFGGFVFWVMANSGMPGEQGSHYFIKKVYDRDVLRNDIIGKSLPRAHSYLYEEPQRSNNGDDAFWIYERITRDPASGEVDPFTVIWFRRAVAVDITSTKVKPTLPPIAQKVYSRDEYKKAVLDRSMNEIRAELGEPGRMSDETENAYWVYYKMVRNPASGRVDFLTIISFCDGVAYDVDF
jgi:hypothetical protein